MGRECSLYHICMKLQPVRRQTHALLIAGQRLSSIAAKTSKTNEIGEPWEGRRVTKLIANQGAKLRYRKIIRSFVAGAVLAIASHGAVADLIDRGNYTSDTSSGLDWLDLNETAGMSVTSALSWNQGWSYANETQVSSLLSHFGIQYGFNPGSTLVLNVTSQQARGFMDLLGETYWSRYYGPDFVIAGSLGGFYNSVAGTGGRSTYLCISLGACANGSFVHDTDQSTYTAANVGQFLVRNSLTQPIPEPETYALMLAGLGLLGLMARRRKQSQS